MIESNKKIKPYGQKYDIFYIIARLLQFFLYKQFTAATTPHYFLMIK